MKKGKMSKVELSYIENNPNLSPEEIAKDLDRSVESVQKKMEAIAGDTGEETPERPRNDFRKHLVNKTGSGREGITVMTQAASERIDEYRKKNIDKIKHSRGTEDAIHHPLGGKDDSGE